MSDLAAALAMAKTSQIRADQAYALALRGGKTATSAASTATAAAANSIPKAIIQAANDFIVGAGPSNPVRLSLADTRALIGAGGFPSFATPPAVADPRDEEFNSGSVVPPATWSQGGTPVAGAIDPYASIVTSSYLTSWNTLRPSWCMFQHGDNGGAGAFSAVLYKPITLALNDLVYARVAVETRGTLNPNDALLGIGLHSAAPPTATSDRVALFVNVALGNQLRVQADTIIAGVQTATIFNVTYNGLQFLEPLEYLFIHKKTTGYHFWLAGASMNLTYIGYLTYVAAITHVSVLTGNTTDLWVAGGAGSPRVGIDFLRFKATATDLP